MKVCVLRTYTEDMARIWLSLDEAGHEVGACLKYDEMDHEEIIRLVQHNKPEAIVFIGALEKYHQKPVPTIDTLLQLREIAPMIHICPDAGEPVWWDQLEQYDKAQCFSRQIGIDGYMDSHGNCEPTLAPVAAKLFKLIPWSERKIDLGLIGPHTGTFAQTTLRYASAFHNARWLRGGSYEEIAAFLCNCKMVMNVSWNSLENGHHVTPLVSDIAAAGACLIETENKETANWFPPSSFYTYEDYKGVANLMKTDLPTEQPMKKAAEMRQHFMDWHLDFWPRIFKL